MLCQNRAVEGFQQAVQTARLGHSYIFAGDDGVGRYLTATEWAKSLLCSEPTTDGGFFDSCGKCRSCKLFESGNHPDFKHIYKELIQFSKITANRSKSPSQFPIDVIREFVIDEVANKPQMSERVVYVISEAEKMAAPAQNAMLKTLEEPPNYCLIILLCTKTDKLLPTILSRSQVIRFGGIDEDIIAARLSEKGVSSEQGIFWARFTGGSLGEALMYAAMSEKCDCYAIKCELLDKLSQMRLADSLNVAEWIVAKSADISAALAEHFEGVGSGDLKRRAQKIMLGFMLSVATDIMRLSVGDVANVINSTQLDKLQTLCGCIDTNTATKFVEKVNSSIQWVDAYVNEKLIFEEILLHFTKLKN